MNLLKRFYRYQDERFPLKILSFTTIAVVLSSAAILGYRISIWQIVLNFVACMTYLYHIRVIDESRDEEHDRSYHPDRPVQRGLISIRELFFIDLTGLALFVLCMLWYGLPTIIYGIILLVFSLAAWKDFFLGDRLKRHFLLYNAVNMFQMVLLQLFIYALFTGSYSITPVMWIHLLFVIFNTIILEFVRKIKTSEDESQGQDTYSWHLGYARSLRYFYLFTLLNFVTFLWMLYTLSHEILVYSLIALGIQGLVAVATFLHLRQRKKTTEQFLLLSAVINYVGLNLLIYIFNI